MTPKFSVVAIARNEAKTLPRLLSSLSGFQAQGGEVVVVDTGSTDNTASVARDWGCIVFEEGPRFIKVLEKDICHKINKKFIVKGDQPVVKEGDKLFEFSAARNYAASKASNDWVLMMDCDEVLTKFDFDKLAAAIESPKVGRLEFEFIYAHDQFGKPIIQFRMSRFYHRDKFHWNPHSIVHEVLTNLVEHDADSVYFGQDVILSEHWQNPQTNRGGYLVGLALDCFLHPDNDRNSHYFGRELMYKGRYASAIQELNRHVGMNRWAAERAQSIVFIGDCFKAMGEEDAAVECWQRAYLADGQRREALMRLAHHFFAKDDKHKTAAYASAALMLPRTGLFYGDNENHYRQEPHELLYWALWYLGDREGSRAHWQKAISYQPLNPKYLHDAQFYLTPGLTLESFGQAIKIRQPFSFVKLGDGERACMNGATGANCDGQPYSAALASALNTAYEFLVGKVHVVDFFNQKVFNMLLHRTDSDLTAVKSFWETVSSATGVKVFVGPARLRPAAELLKARFIEVPLVDAFSDLERIKKQLFDHCKRDAICIFCAGATSKILIAEMLKVRQDITCLDAGSSFDPMFVGETRTLQAPKAVLDRLYSGTPETSYPRVTICVPTLGREGKLKRLLDLIPKTAEYPNYDVLVEQDSFENNVGVPKLLRKMVEASKGEFIAFLGNDCVPHPGWLRLAMEMMRAKFPDTGGLVGLNDLYWHGEFSPHWVASKKLLPMLDGEFFHTGYHHVGCDNELSERCRKAGKYAWCEQAVVYHDHPMQPGAKIEHDRVYDLARVYEKEDRELFKSRAEKFDFPYHAFYTKPGE